MEQRTVVDLPQKWRLGAPNSSVLCSYDRAVVACRGGRGLRVPELSEECVRSRLLVNDSEAVIGSC